MSGKVPQSREFHFEEVAERYCRLRQTDKAPVDAIRQIIAGNRGPIRAADVGCGPGRYSELLFNILPNGSHLECLDRSAKMLDQVPLEAMLARSDGKTVGVKRSTAENLPFDSEYLNLIACFNAIHHFDPKKFFTEAVRVLITGSPLFIYTRLREQNEDTIWGRLFPEFCKHEDRVPARDTLVGQLQTTAGLQFDREIPFEFQRIDTIEDLIARVRGKYYSVFSRYTQDKLDTAVVEFNHAVERTYNDVTKIQHPSKYSLFVAHKV
ncbi:MAG: class I SAM-dependent methyltransferase [Patescibacteria group bacterium]